MFRLNNRGVTSLFLLLALVLTSAIVVVTVYLLFQNKKPAQIVKVKKIGVIQYLKTLQLGTDGFKEEMKNLDYSEGRDVTYEYQLADGKSEELVKIANTYIDQNVDLIFVDAVEGALAAIKATKEKNKTNIPIVFIINTSNPINPELIYSFKSSGNNATGVAIDMTKLTAKRLEFLLEINPKIKKVLAISSKVTDPTSTENFLQLRAQAPKLGIELVEHTLNSPPGPDSTKELEQLLAKIKPGQVDAYIHTAGPVINYPANQKVLAEFAKKRKIPSVYLKDFKEEDGWLFSYGHDIFEAGKQASSFANKILKGIHPSDIPIEYNRKNFVTINLKAAKELSIQFPNSILDIADKKIE